MEAQYRNAEVMVHMESDTPEIRLEGHVNVGSGKSNWVTLTIAGLTISFFTPTPMGVLHIFDEFKKGTLMKNYSEEETTQEQESPSLESIQVEITSYNADPAQTDSTPLITASGVTVAEDICALSRDIEREYGLKFGDIIHIEGYGEFSFQDRMNKRIVRGVDIFRWSRREALEIGRRQGRISFTSRTINYENSQRAQRAKPSELKKG